MLFILQACSKRFLLAFKLYGQYLDSIGFTSASFQQNKLHVTDQLKDLICLGIRSPYSFFIWLWFWVVENKISRQTS